MFSKSSLLLCFILNIGIHNPIYASENNNFTNRKYISNIEQELDYNEQGIIEDNLSSPLEAKISADTSNKYSSYNHSTIIALNKITARSQSLKMTIREPQYFGNIEIKVHKCSKNNDPYSPQSNALLSIIEDRIDEERNVLFQGWINSSSISLSTFEHPVYEIFLKDCQ